MDIWRYSCIVDFIQYLSSLVPRAYCSRADTRLAPLESFHIKHRSYPVDLNTGVSVFSREVDLNAWLGFDHASPAVCVHCEAEAVAIGDQMSRHRFEVCSCLIIMALRLRKLISNGNCVLKVTFPVLSR